MYRYPYRLITILFSQYILTGCSGLAVQPETKPDVMASNEGQRPNILFIVADDLGYSDIGPMGSEIQTPNIDALAERGVLFTRFYAAATCSPTRSMLLTGVDHHKAGLGNMAEFITDNQIGQPGYEGYINNSVVTLPEILRDANYHTYMVGKWHLGLDYENSPKSRGFERTFVLLNGAASHFDDMKGIEIHRPKANYREDGELIASLPKGFYSSHFYTDKLISYMKSNGQDGQPFFAYASYTSPHWPIQAPEKTIDKYAGRYAQGYDSVRAQRYKRLKALSIIPQGSTYPKRPDFIPDWNSLSAKEQMRAAREMEVYAAMVDDLDSNIGRLIHYLKVSEQLENTIIVFLSDNGSDGFSLARAPKAIANHAKKFDNSLANVGHPNSFSFIGPKWAHVGEAPFRLYKTMPTEGGIRVPAIISYPSHGLSGQMNHSSVSVMDLVPTVLELAGIESFTTYNDKPVLKHDGRSLLPLLTGHLSRIRSKNDVIGVELLGRRAIIKGDWKIVYFPTPIGHGNWELFDLSKDPGEQHDMAEIMPNKLAELTADWAHYQQENGVILGSPGPLVLRPTPIPNR